VVKCPGDRHPACRQQHLLTCPGRQDRIAGHSIPAGFLDWTVLRCIWTFPPKQRPRIQQALDREENRLAPVVFRRDAAAARFLAAVPG
jgi:hypothetical protein